MSLIYLIGSLRNPEIPVIGNYLRSKGFEVFDDWFAAGPIADDSWQKYEEARGHSSAEALKGHASKHIFAFDFFHLNRADMAVLALPAGKSGHLELGYTIGKGKPGYILYDKEPDRWDQMYQFSNGIFYDKESLGDELEQTFLTPC